MAREKLTEASAKVLDPKKEPWFFLAWSHSRWKVYFECPKHYWFQYVKRYPVPKEEKSPALIHGDEVHKVADRHVKETVHLRHVATRKTKAQEKEIAKRFSNPPPELRLYRAEFEELIEVHKAITEEDWAFNYQWKPLPYWFDPPGVKQPEKVWVRIKTDLHHALPENGIKIIDLKTGKPPYNADGYLSQLELYALGAFKMYEGVRYVETALWYLDHHVSPGKRYELKEVPALEKLWFDRVKPMATDTLWKENPGSACKFCQYKKAVGGPCKY